MRHELNLEFTNRVLFSQSPVRLCTVFNISTSENVVFTILEIILYSDVLCFIKIQIWKKDQCTELPVAGNAVVSALFFVVCTSIYV